MKPIVIWQNAQKRAVFLAPDRDIIIESVSFDALGERVWTWAGTVEKATTSHHIITALVSKMVGSAFDKQAEETAMAAGLQYKAPA